MTAVTSTIERLRTAFPLGARSLDAIERLRSRAERLPIAPFYEPVSVLNRDSKGRSTLVELDAAMLNAWAKHIAYSMRARLGSFELGTLAELGAGRQLTSTTLLRAHLEASAMAALCVITLNESRSAESDEALRKLVPQTLFGTALFTKAAKDERVEEWLALAEQRTITICTAIDAFDRFAYGDAATGSTPILYSLLWESAHPNHRGTRPFASSREVEPEGWEITYGEETLAEEVVVGLLDGLHRSMRAGYAATEMLRAATFENVAPYYRGLSTDIGQAIWDGFLAPDA